MGKRKSKIGEKTGGVSECETGQQASNTNMKKVKSGGQHRKGAYVE